VVCVVSEGTVVDVVVDSGGSVDGSTDALEELVPELQAISVQVAANTRHHLDRRCSPTRVGEVDINDCHFAVRLDGPPLRLS